MYYIFCTVNIIAVFLMLLMLAVVIRQQPSKVLTAFILYDAFTIVYIFGIHLELIHADTVGEALSGLCVQYVGQAGFLMALLWFISEFAHIKVPAWMYVLQAVIESAVVAGIFTAEHHTYFYSSMSILTDGMYNRIKVTRGILWHLHFVYVYAVILVIIVLCIWQYQKGTRIHRRRIFCIAVGIGALGFELTLKIMGVFGSYNPIVCAMVFTAFCMMIAIVKYGYFNSLHAAVDNAFNHGDEGLIIIDRENVIIFINQRMESMFPNIRTGDNICGQTEIMEVLKGSSHMMEREEAVYELRMEDIIENGEKNGYMIWFIDQTEHLKIMRQLKAADEAKTQFLMKVSHELRTPMNTILGMNEMIARESREAQIRNYAKEVASAGKSMMALIEEVLDASRLENGKLELKNRPIWIPDIVYRAKMMMVPQAEAKGLSIEIDVRDELLDKTLKVFGDEARISQILTNLLSNAVKYTEQGGILLEAGIEQNSVFFSVSDTGIGIGEEEQQRIFDSFERGSYAKKSEKDGLGLGLAIVKQLTGVMGGTVTVKSTLGEGSIFRVTIPCMKSEGTNQADQADSKSCTIEDVKKGVIADQTNEKIVQTEAVSELSNERTVGEDEKQSDIPDLHTRTILAADDNEHNLMVLSHLLKRTRVSLETVTNGMEAVEICRLKKYDLILLDHMMPSMDGIETLHFIRADREGKNNNTKAVALTANATASAEQLYADHGFADYVVKPIHPQKLEAVLSRHLNMTYSADTTGDVLEKERDDIRKKYQFLEERGICVEDGLCYAGDDPEFYMELLELFAEEEEKKEQELDALSARLTFDAAQEVWNTFISKTHKIKSESFGIGAPALGELFYQLEIAGNHREQSLIQKKYPEAIEELRRTAAVINDFFAANSLQ